MRYSNSYIGTEHLLLGLLHPFEKNRGSEILTQLCRRTALLEEEVLRIMIVRGQNAGTVIRSPRFNEGARNVVAFAAREIDLRFFEPEHVLAGLILEEQGIAAEALRNCKVRLSDVRFQISQTLN